MRNSTALKKNLTIKFRYWRPVCGGQSEQLSMRINNIEICIFGPRCIRIIEEVFNHQFTEREEIEFTAKTFKVDKRELFINDTFITDLDYERMWLVNYAFAKVTKYSIAIRHIIFRYGYVRSLDGCDVYTTGEFIDEIEVKPEELDSTLNKLKELYLPLVTHNCTFTFDVTEFKGEPNMRFKYEVVGAEPENFDENIREKLSFGN